jgi:hypothetical protein
VTSWLDMESLRNKNQFEQLLIPFLFLLIPLGVSFWKVTGTLDQYTEFRWMLVFGICILLLAGSFLTRFEIRIPDFSRNRGFYALSGGLSFFCLLALLLNLPGQIELQLLEWSCFSILFCWSFTLSTEEDSRTLLWRSIRFANRIGLAGVIAYLIAQESGHPWKYLAWYSGHLGSLFGHKNYAAAFYGISILIELSGLERKASPLKRVVPALVVLAGLYGLYCAKARGATLGFGIGLLFFYGKKLEWKARTKWIAAAILVVAACYAAAVLSYRGLENGANTRDIRIARWLNTGAMILDHPLGIGPGHYEYDYLLYTKKVRPDVEIDGRFVSKTPHNQPLQIGIDYGIPALLFWILLTGFFLRLALRSDSPAGSILVCILVDGLFAFPLHVTHSFLAYAVFSGILAGTGLSFRVLSPTPLLSGFKLIVLGGMSWVTWAVVASVMAESYDVNHLESMKTACGLAPWRFKNCLYLAKIQGNEHRFEDGIETCRKILRRQPNGFTAYAMLSELYRLSGDASSRCDALREYDRILGGDTSVFKSMRAACSKGSAMKSGD